MRKFFKGVSAMMAMTLAMGLFTGCGDKVMNVTYDYNADEYVKVGEYKGIEVELDDYTVTEKDLQNVIDQIVEKYVNYKVVDRPAQDGDMVVVSFDSYISGSKVEGFSSKDYKLVIGSGEFLIDGFEEAMIGLSAGEKRAITGLHVPENFKTEEKYAGRAITFNIEISGVYEPVLPAYDDELVAKITEGEFTTVDAYNQELMSMLEENAQTNYYNDKYNQILDKIISNTEVIKEFPEEYISSKSASIQEEVDKYKILYEMTDSEYMMKYYGVETVEEAARNQILLEFIFEEIIKNENLTVTQSYYKEHLQETADARQYSSVEKFVNAFTENGVVKCMLLDKATDLIMDSAVEK